MTGMIYRASDTAAEAYGKGYAIGLTGPARRPPPRAYGERQREAWLAGFGRARDDCAADHQAREQRR